MKTACPHCRQEYEVSADYLGTPVECVKCLKTFPVQELKEAAPASKPVLTPIRSGTQPESKDVSGGKTTIPLNKLKQLKHNPALVGALCCLLIAAVINFYSNLLFFLWVPLYLVVFILGIVAIVQQRVGKGICFVIASIMLPAFLCIFNVFFVGSVMAASQKSKEKAEQKYWKDFVSATPYLGGDEIKVKNSNKSVSLRSSSASSPVVEEKPSADQHRQKMIDLAKSISRPSEQHIINMLQQVALAEKTKAVRNNSQDYCRIEIVEKELYNSVVINNYQKEIELGLLTQVEKSLRPTARARQVNGTYEYSYVPDKVMRILPPSYDQKTDSIDCVVTYNVSLQGIPGYVLDNAHVLDKWASWRWSIKLYNIKLADSRSITFFWSQSRREWMLKHDGAIYNYQSDFKFEAINNEIKFVPEPPRLAATPPVPPVQPVDPANPPASETPATIVVPPVPARHLFHSPWERLRLIDITSSAKPYSAAIDRITTSGNRENWHATIRFTDDQNRSIVRSARMGEDVVVGPDSYKITDLSAPPPARRRGAQLEATFPQPTAIELMNMATGEKLRIVDKETVKFNDYRAELLNLETRQTLTLSIGDQLSVEHNRETFEYKVNVIKRELARTGIRAYQESVIIEDLKSGIKTTIRKDP